MKLKPQRKPEAVIPVAAMSDIAFLLIIFFMLVSKIVQQDVPIEKPAGVTVEENEIAPTSVLIAMEVLVDPETGKEKKGPVLYLNSVQTDMGRLTTSLQKILVGATAEGAREVAVEADAKAPNAIVSEVLRAVSSAGGNLTLIADKKTAESGEGD